MTVSFNIDAELVGALVAAQGEPYADEDVGQGPPWGKHLQTPRPAEAGLGSSGTRQPGVRAISCRARRVTKGRYSPQGR